MTKGCMKIVKPSPEVTIDALVFLLHLVQQHVQPKQLRQPGGKSNLKELLKKQTK